MNNQEFIKTPTSSQLRTQIAEDRSRAQGGTEHYSGWLVGDFIHSAGLDFFEGNVVKYVSRHRKKNGRADLVKARTYIDKLLELNYPTVANG